MGCGKKEKCYKSANISTKNTIADVERQEDTTPANPNVAVGIDRFITPVNSNWSIYNKNSGQLISRTAATEMFAGIPSSIDSRVSNPVVYWDEFTNRFIGNVVERSNFNITGKVVVDFPAGIAGEYPAKVASRGGPPPDLSGLEIVPANPLNADTPLTPGSLTGKIALIAADGFVTGSLNKVRNAALAGAIGAIIFQDTEILGPGINGFFQIPSVVCTLSTGLLLLNNPGAIGGIGTANVLDVNSYSRMHIIVSKDSSPNTKDDFYNYEIDVYPNLFAGFPKIGLDEDAVYISSQDVEPGSPDYKLYKHIVAVAKAPLINGTATSPLALLVNDIQLVDTYARTSNDFFSYPIQTPSFLHAPTSTPQVTFFLQPDIDFKRSRTNQNGNGVIIKAITDILGVPKITSFRIPVQTWTSEKTPEEYSGWPVAQPPGIFQQENGDPLYRLDTVTPVFNYRAVIHKESLWACMDIGNPDKTEVRWYEFDISKIFSAAKITLKQEGKIVPEGTTSAFYSSIDVDKDGNMGIGFNISGPDQVLSLAHTGRLKCDPHGTLRFPYKVNFPAQPDLPYYDFSIVQSPTGIWASQWNGYTSCVLDPVDRKRFWFASEYSDLNEEEYRRSIPQWKVGLVNFCVTGKPKNKPSKDVIPCGCKK